MKKFLSLVLALVMTMSLVTIGAGAKDFTDAEKVNYAEAVDVMSAVKVIDGYTDGSFKPQDTLTRGAAAKIICNLILGPTTASALTADTAPYKDVPVGSTFAGYIAYCQKEGIISGYNDGTFRPGNTLTGYAFMKMLLGALGYDAEIEGYVGPNWSINVAKQALSIDLDDGNKDEFNGAKAVTREEACLYAFNTLKANMVEYENKTTVEVNGATVNVGGQDAKDMENHNSSTDGNIEDDKIMQFAEKYFTDLKKTNSSNDDLGRPCNEWKYKTETAGTYVDTSTLAASYTEAVERGQVYDLFGKSTYDDIEDGTSELKVYLNGVLLKEGKDYELNDLVKKNSTDDAGWSGRGVLSEVYVDDDADAGKDDDGDLITVVFIPTYLVQATADYNSNKEELSIDLVSDEYLDDDYPRPANFPNSIDMDDFDVSDYKEDDYILVTYSDDAKEIQSVQPATILEGEVDTYKERDSITIEGTKYKYNALVSSEGQDESFSIGDPAKLVMDSYGYIMYVDEANTSGDYVYIADTADASGLGRKAKAAGYFTDGTYAELTVKKITDKDNKDHTSAEEIDKLENDLRGWYTYSVNSSDEYTLKAVSKSGAIKNTKYDSFVTDFSTPVQIIENELVKFLKGEDVKANNETVFIVLDSDDDIDIYTGLANAPDITISGKDTVYVSWIEGTSGNKDGYATYVFVDLKNDPDADVDDATSSDDYLFVLKNNGKKVNVSEDKDYYDVEVISEGEVKTVRVDDYKEFDVGVLYNKIKTNSDEYLTEGEEIGNDNDELQILDATVAIKHSKGTLTMADKDNKAHEYILGNDADINLIVAGNDDNKALLKDDGADYETYLGISGTSLAGYLKGYDLVYDVYAALDDNGSDIINVLYVYVTSAKEDNTAKFDVTVKATGEADKTVQVAEGETSFEYTVPTGKKLTAVKGGTASGETGTVTITMDKPITADTTVEITLEKLPGELVTLSLNGFDTDKTKVWDENGEACEAKETIDGLSVKVEKGSTVTVKSTANPNEIPVGTYMIAGEPVAVTTEGKLVLTVNGTMTLNKSDLTASVLAVKLGDGIDVESNSDAAADKILARDGNTVYVKTGASLKVTVDSDVASAFIATTDGKKFGSAASSPVTITGATGLYAASQVTDSGYVTEKLGSDTITSGQYVAVGETLTLTSTVTGEGVYAGATSSYGKAITTHTVGKDAANFESGKIVTLGKGVTAKVGTTTYGEGDKLAVYTGVAIDTLDVDTAVGTTIVKQPVGAFTKDSSDVVDDSTTISTALTLVAATKVTVPINTTVSYVSQPSNIPVEITKTAGDVYVLSGTVIEIVKDSGAVTVTGADVIAHDDATHWAKVEVGSTAITIA